MLTKVKRLIAHWRYGIKIDVTEHFFIVIQGLRIVYVYKPEKESIIYIGRVRC